MGKHVALNTAVTHFKTVFYSAYKLPSDISPSVYKPIQTPGLISVSLRYVVQLYPWCNMVLSFALVYGSILIVYEPKKNTKLYQG